MKNSPSASEVTTTSTTDSPPIAPNSRRKFIAGIDTADEYRSGGSTPARIHSGSISTEAKTGRKLAPTPASTSTSGDATPSLGPTRVANAITTRATTRMTSVSVMAPA